jgi:6-phosphogluconolactonase
MRVRSLVLIFSTLTPALLAFACSSDPATSSQNPENDAAVAIDASDAAMASDAPVVDAALGGQLFAFVGSSDGNIRTYTVDETNGAWTYRAASLIGTTPSFLAFDPPNHRVLAIDEATNVVRSLSFDPTSGSLTEKNNQPSGGTDPAFVSLDPTAHWAFVANYGGGNMSVFPIDATGMIGAASDTQNSGAMSHWAGTNPSGDHVFVASLGANVVDQYSWNHTTGKLTANGTASPPASSGPRHLAFHPNEKYAYLMSETAITVTTFAYDKPSGQLTAHGTISALPPAQDPTGVSGAEIVVHPSGKFVYGSTRVFDSIVQFSVSDTDGSLTRVANVMTGGDRPRSFGMTPDGNFLFAGNQDANEVVGFKIDATTGTLTSLGKTVDVTGPAFVGLVRVPE